MEEIIWKRHLDTIYDVSSIGTVRNRETGKNIKLSKKSTGYLVWGCYNGLKVDTYVHRAVALAFLPNPEGYPTVDHKNQNKTDNRLENLRWASVSMQNRNQSNRGEVPFKGVSKDGKKFRARIKINGKTVHIGIYGTAEEASASFAARFTQEGFDV